MSGSGPTAELVAAAIATAWPAVAIVGGVLLVLAGIAVLVTGTRWPTSSRRYRAARLADADEVAGHEAGGRAASDRAIDDWDELSRGDDPTADAVAGPAGDVAAETAPDASQDTDRDRRRRHHARPTTTRWAARARPVPAARLAPETPATKEHHEH